MKDKWFDKLSVFKKEKESLEECEKLDELLKTTKSEIYQVA